MTDWPSSLDRTRKEWVMGVSMITCMMIAGNDTRIYELERCELWLLHDGEPHTLLASCPLDKRHEMEDFIAMCKSGEIWKPIETPTA